MDPFTVGGDDNTLDLPEFEVFEDLPEAHDQTSLHAGLHRVFLVQPVLEAHQLFQQVGHTLVHIFTQHLAAVTGRQYLNGVCVSSSMVKSICLESYLVSVRNGNHDGLLSEFPAVDFGSRGRAGLWLRLVGWLFSLLRLLLSLLLSVPLSLPLYF